MTTVEHVSVEVERGPFVALSVTVPLGPLCRTRSLRPHEARAVADMLTKAADEVEARLKRTTSVPGATLISNAGTILRSGDVVLEFASEDEAKGFASNPFDPHSIVRRVTVIDGFAGAPASVHFVYPIVIYRPNAV